MFSYNQKPLTAVNNEIYSRLGDRWYDAEDDPVALLRAEARLRNPWVAKQISSRVASKTCDVLDIGCGAGFLTNYLAGLGHEVTGLDEAEDSLAVAGDHDQTGRVRYQRGDATALPYENGSFDVVCAMDLLEHVEDPALVIAEAARVLRPSGLFFFHTFNRNWLSWLVVIKGVEWFVKNTPEHMHVLRLFLKPSEIESMCKKSGMVVERFIGSRPKLGAPFLSMLKNRVVPPTFEFTFTPSTKLGFTGYACKQR